MSLRFFAIKKFENINEYDLIDLNQLKKEFI